MPPIKLPDLAPSQTRRARDLFVISLYEPAEIATELGVNLGSVSRAKTRGKWVLERRRYASQEEVQKRRAEHAARMAAIREDVEIGCAELGLTRVRTQLKSANRLEALVDDPSTPMLSSKDGGQGLATALGSPAPDIEKARLSVGLSTDRTETDDDRADEFCRGYVAAIAEQLGVVAPGSPPGDPPSVEPAEPPGAPVVAGRA